MADASKLIERLYETKDLLSRIVQQLEARAQNGELPASDEKTLRRARRAVRSIVNEHLPWARLNPDAAKSAEIEFYLYGIWAYFGLEPREE